MNIALHLQKRIYYTFYLENKLIFEEIVARFYSHNEVWFSNAEKVQENRNSVAF